MRTLVQGAVIAALVLGSGVARAQDIDDAGLVYYGFTADRLEYRFGDDEDVIAVEADAFVGTDKFKARLESEVEYGIRDGCAGGRPDQSCRHERVKGHRS